MPERPPDPVDPNPIPSIHPYNKVTPNTATPTPPASSATSSLSAVKPGNGVPGAKSPEIRTTQPGPSGSALGGSRPAYGAASATELAEIERQRRSGELIHPHDAPPAPTGHRAHLGENEKLTSSREQVPLRQSTGLDGDHSWLGRQPKRTHQPSHTWHSAASSSPPPPPPSCPPAPTARSGHTHQRQYPRPARCSGTRNRSTKPLFGNKQFFHPRISRSTSSTTRCASRNGWPRRWNRWRQVLGLWTVWGMEGSRYPRKGKT